MKYNARACFVTSWKVSNGFFLETERKKRFLTSWNFLEASCIISSSGDKAVGER